MPTPSPANGPGGMHMFNILHGYPEALVRGMRSSFLQDSDYHHLTQCESLDDVRLNLTESDYAESIVDATSVTPASLQKAAIEKVRIVVCFGGRGLENGLRKSIRKIPLLPEKVERLRESYLLSPAPFIDPCSFLFPCVSL